MLLIAAFSGCGSNPTRPTNFPVPASISLNPAANASIDVGTTLTFTAAPHNSSGVNITTPISFQTSNASVLTVANNGLACAGTWDSLAAPQICTPGQVGVAQVTATARGVNSPPTTVYVHQHIHHIDVSANPGQNSGDCHIPLNSGNPVTQLSKGQTFNYQATAFALTSTGLTDITPTVGVFIWQSQNASVATVSTTAGGLNPGEIQVTAATPGITSIFASVSNVNSVPFDFLTCPVQSISLEVTGESGTDIIVPRGTGKSIVPTVIDTQGITITGVPLTWCSSHPTSVNVGTSNCATNTGESISVTTSQVGGGTVTASCTPPTCNIGLQPTRPIYPQDPVRFQVVTTTGGTNPTITAFVSSTECDSIDACVSEVVPLTAPNNTPGTPVSLSARPNSLVFDRQGSKAYLGTNSSLLGTTGLNILTAAATSSSARVKNVTGKVLTVSPDGKKVLIADTNQVFVLDTTSNTVTSLPITGAVQVDFSADSLKAFIAAGNKVFVFSAVDPLTSIDLGSVVSSVSFLPVGAFAYAATASSLIPIGTCSQQPGAPFATSSTRFLTALPPGAGITLFPAAVQPTINNVLVSADNSGITLTGVQATSVGCPDPATAVTTGPTQSFSFSQGTFTPNQLIVSADGQAVYVVPADLASILVFNLSSGTPTPIALIGNALPIQASLSTDGSLMYVAAGDAQVHVLNTQTFQDVQQIAFPFFPNSLQNDLCAGKETPCRPDLIAVKP